LTNAIKMGPIGIFDSGYGGLTILNAIRKQLPRYDYIYLGDNARTPYGTRSYEVVYQYTLECVEELFSMGCQLVILACNTASAKALRTIQQLDLPRIDSSRRVLGVIRPTIEKLPEFTQTGHVGLLATPGTVQSGSYPLEIHKIDPSIHVVSVACPMWVPLIENNEHLSPGAEFFVEKNLQELIGQDDKIDTIILGCTHYPLLIPVIRKFIPEHIQVISQGEIVASSLADYLSRHPEIEQKCSKGGSCVYFTTESPLKFNELALQILRDEIEAKQLSIQ
jgi:glutamate racemase